MTIEEAVKILANWSCGKGYSTLDDLNKATKLGIEALKRLKESRLPDYPIRLDLLPGETAK